MIMHTIQALIQHATSQYADIPAVRWAVRKNIFSKTYRDLWNDSEKVRTWLDGLGNADLHAAILGPSSYPWITSYLGIVDGGYVAVPLDLMLPDNELIDLINRSDSEVLFCTPAKAELIKLASEQCPNLKNIVLLTDETDNDAITWAALIQMETLPAKKEVSPENLSTIIFTSGTTGKSKGVLLTQQNQADNVENIYIEGESGMVLLSVLPIHHAYCLTAEWLKGFTKGATICINDSLLHMMSNIKKFQPRIMLMVPLMLETVYKQIQRVADKYTPEQIYQDIFGGNLEYIFSGGAHLEPFYVEEYEKYGIKVCEGYGMSECAPVISTNGQLGWRPGSVGLPLKNVEVKFADGELLVRGSSVMQGYYHMPEETAETLQDGWLHTGDLGYQDEDGYLYITGRSKNLIILAGGENISPEELEGKLAMCPLIAEIIVTGAGNGLKAHIFPDAEYAQNASISEADIPQQIQAFIDEFNQSQPTYRHITAMEMRTEPFEKSATQKIKRALVK